jgi:hypothetical protein
VKFGVYFILIMHLLECLWVTFMTFIFIIGKSVSMLQYSFSDIGMQTAFACFALAGIPIILVGLWGVRYGVEACLRVYLFYMSLSFLIDVMYASNQFLFHHTCDQIPTIMAQQGRAWACGVGRIFDAASFFLMMAIPAYLIFIVYSYCEDMTEGGAGPDLSDLTSIGKHRKWNPAHFDPYSSVLGLSSYVDGEYGSIYGKKVPTGLGGGRPILDGRYHELAYPPPSIPRGGFGGTAE